MYLIYISCHVFINLSLPCVLSVHPCPNPLKAGPPLQQLPLRRTWTAHHPLALPPTLGPPRPLTPDITLHLLTNHIQVVEHPKTHSSSAGSRMTQRTLTTGQKLDDGLLLLRYDFFHPRSINKIATLTHSLQCPPLPFHSAALLTLEASKASNAI